MKLYEKIRTLSLPQQASLKLARRFIGRAWEITDVWIKKEMLIIASTTHIPWI